jgi:hypothetical protein
VRTWFETAEDVDLVYSSFFQFRKLLEFVGLHHFNCDFLLIGEVNSFVDSGIDSGSKFMLK